MASGGRPRTVPNHQLPCANFGAHSSVTLLLLFRGTKHSAKFRTLARFWSSWFWRFGAFKMHYYGDGGGGQTLLACRRPASEQFARQLQHDLMAVQLALSERWREGREAPPPWPHPAQSGITARDILSCHFVSLLRIPKPLACE